MSCNLIQIVGLKVVTVRAFRGDRRIKTRLKPAYILFSDKKTYIDLQEQDPYSYHDCNFSAREILVIQDKKRWKQISEDKNGYYPEANDEL